MFSRFNQALILSAVMVFGFGSCESNAMAQGGGDLGGGVIPGQGTGGQNTGGQNTGGQNTGGQNTGSSGNNSSTTSQSNQGVGDLGNAIELQPIENTRNQGFVGTTASKITDGGFVGRAGSLTAAPLADGASLGGGVNDSVNSSVNIGGGGAGAGVAGFGAAATNAVNIARRNLRSAVRPSFAAPQLSGTQVSSRFNNRLMRQPGAQPQANTYSISIQDKTATLRGSVGTQAESERLVRQLRLEPGVYKIVNQLQVLK